LAFFGLANVPESPLAKVAHGLAKSALYIAIGIGGINLLFTALRRELRVRWARKKKDHVIVCGLGEIGLQIVENLRAPWENGVVVQFKRWLSAAIELLRGAQDEQNDAVPHVANGVVVVEFKQEPENMATAEQLGATVIQGDARKHSVLKSAGLKGAHTIVVCTGDDARNVDVALRAMGHILGSRRAREKPKLILIELRDEWLFGRLIDQNKQPLSKPGVEIRFFNTYQDSARQLFARLPPPKAVGDPAKPVWIVGFGMLGREVAVQALQAGFAPLDQKTRLTVLDREGAQQARLFAPVLDPISAYSEVTFHDCDLAPNKMENWDSAAKLLREEGAAAIAVCLSEDNESLYAAVEFRSLLDKFGRENVPVFVRLGRNARLGRLVGEIEESQSNQQRLQAFGQYAEVLSIDVLLGAKLDRLARVAHEIWPESAPKAVSKTDWDKLAERDKMLCRHDADQLAVRLAQVGLTLTEAENGESIIFEFSDEQVEVMAQLAHRRWRIEKLMRGRKPEHPDWAQLDEGVRERNRDKVRKTPTLLAKAGWQIGPALAREKAVLHTAATRRHKASPPHQHEISTSTTIVSLGEPLHPSQPAG